MGKLSILLALSSLMVGTGTFASAQTKYPLRCRGPLNYAVGTGQRTTVVFFTKNATRSGERGISLSQGACAWTDRTVNANEPSKIYVKPEEGTSKVHAAFTAFTACAGESRCVVEFLAYNAFNTSDPHFRVEDPYVRIYYPAFP
jgi:hypothetical protein